MSLHYLHKKPNHRGRDLFDWLRERELRQQSHRTKAGSPFRRSDPCCGCTCPLCGSWRGAALMSGITLPEMPADPCEPGQFLLAAIRCARARIELLKCELDEIGIALRFGMIEPEGATQWLHELDALRFVNPDALPEGVSQ